MELVKQFKTTLKNKNEDFMLLGILGASLLGNILVGKEAIAKRQGRGVIRAGDGTTTKRQGREFIRAGYGSTIKNKDF